MAHQRQPITAIEVRPARLTLWFGLGVGRLVAAVVFLFAMVIMAAAVLAHTLPATRIALTFDIATPLALHAALAGAVALLAMMSRRWAWPVLMIGLPAIVAVHAAGAALQASDTPFSRSSSSMPREHLRVLSLNTWHRHPDIDAVERGIELSNADVVVLIEVGPDKQPMIERLARIYPYRESCAAYWECSVAVLSRYPIIKGDAGRKHLETPPMAVAEIDGRDAGFGTFTVVAAHVHRPSRSPRIHRAHMRALATLAARTPGPLILAGDFNTGAMSASWSELINLTGMRSTAVWAPTWPAIPVALPQVALDHILISPHLSFGRTGTGPNVKSDHLGIWAEVRMRSKASAEAITQTLSAASKSGSAH